MKPDLQKAIIQILDMLDIIYDVLLDLRIDNDELHYSILELEEIRNTIYER